MTANGLIQIGLYLVVLIAAAKPLGTYMARVYEGKTIVVLDRVLGPVERLHLPFERRASRRRNELESLRARRAAVQRRRAAGGVCARNGCKARCR